MVVVVVVDVVVKGGSASMQFMPCRAVGFRVSGLGFRARD